MTIFDLIADHRRKLSPTANDDPLVTLEAEVQEALVLFWQSAANILHDSGINLFEPAPDEHALSQHFFTMLFLYAFHRGGVARDRRVAYTAINQCLRGMVTGCDNLLDDEYKPTLKTDLPERAVRFRSVLDIMVSERILFDLVLGLGEKARLSNDEIRAACTAGLLALTRSGVQEAAEEGGVTQILAPRRVLEEVHHYKTGLLFQSVWRVPLLLEPLAPQRIKPLERALYDIGMGCQILDDLVDLPSDVAARRHNYVASLICHDHPQQAQKLLSQPTSFTSGKREAAKLLNQWPAARQAACRTAMALLRRGLQGLFVAHHHFLITPAMLFVAERIGAECCLEELSL